MKKKIKHTAAFCCFLFVFCFLLQIFTGILMPGKMGTTKNIKDFYKLEKNSLDVLVLGDSSTYRSINPALLWHDDNMTSYVIGAPQARISLLYYVLKDAIKHQKPDTVILEVNCMFDDAEYRIGNKRKIIDSMPLSKTKLEILNDDVLNFTKTQKLSLLFPIMLYKNRYDEITKTELKNYFKPSKQGMKGYIFSDKQKPYQGSVAYMKQMKPIHYNTSSTTYLKQMQALCIANDISLVLVKVPGAREWNLAKHEKITQVAKELALPFYDMNMQMKEAINWQTDTNDGGVHLNAKGSQKVTDSLRTYLNEHQYVNINHHSRKVQESYNAAYRLYIQKLYKGKDVL